MSARKPQRTVKLLASFVTDCRSSLLMSSLAPMGWKRAALLLALCSAASAAEARAPLHDPTALNIGLNCQWQQKCISDQKRAMKRALKYVKKKQPPLWKVQQCNRNAGRKRYRVDWVGFDNCIRNAALRYTPPPPPPRSVKKRRRPIS